MTIIAERPESPRSTETSVTTEWCVTGDDNETQVRALVENTTPNAYVTSRGTFWRSDVTLTHPGFQLYYASVTYSPRKRIAGTYTFSFDTTGGTVHISNSKETISTYAVSGTAPDFKGAIGVDGDRIEGVDIVIPAMKVSVNFKHPLGVINMSYAKQLAYYTGMVNSTGFLTFAAGEVLFLGAQGSDGSDAEADVSYHFAMSQNVTGLSIGDIANVAKKGHEVAWIKYKDAVSESKSVKQAEFAYVERVYDTVDMASVLGFG